MIVNIAPLEQMADSVLASNAWLFQPTTAYEFGGPPGADLEPGQHIFEAQTPGEGAVISYRLASGKKGDTVKVIITDVGGDTITTLNGPATAGLHHVTWNLRGKPAEAEPLTPAGVRDSIVADRKMTHVFDSLATAGVAPKETLDRIHKAMTGGEGLFGLFRRGGGGGPPGSFQERPGESPPPRQPGARGGRGARGGAQSDTAKAAKSDTAKAGARGAQAGGEPPIDREVLGEVFDALRSSGAIQRGFGGGRGRTPMAETGDYLVTLVANGKTQQHPLRVERVSGGSDTAVDAGEWEELLEGRDP
jgi:hypothetical protein